MKDYLYKTTPYAHQDERFKSDRDLPVFAYFWDMGAGKSKIILDTAAWNYAQGRIDLLIVIAPNGVHENWILEEAPTHLPDYVNYRGLYWVPKSNQTKKYQREMVSFFNHNDGLKVFSVNVETLSNKLGVKMLKDVMISFRSMVVVDESSTIKTHDVARTKNLLKINQHARIRRILNGTPVSNAPLDVFTQFAFLDEDILRDGSYYSFRARFADLETVEIPNKKPFKRVTGYRNLEKLQKLIAPFSHRITKEECLDLPEKIYMKRRVELTKEQKTAYEKMRRELFIELDGGRISARLALTKILRLQQIVGGYLGGLEEAVTDFDEIQGELPFPAEDFTVKGNLVEMPSNRIDVLMDVINEADGKIIIWARFVAEIEAILERLRKEHGPGSAVGYYGGIKQKDRPENIALFQGRRPIMKNSQRVGWDEIPEDKQARFFVGNPQSAGMGLTLTAARTVIYFSNSFSYFQRKQSEDRAHRIGQHYPVTYVDLFAPGTIDEKIIATLRTKQDFARIITGDAWKEWI